MGQTYSLFFPPAPKFTEANLPGQAGRVFLVTGGYSGVGYELSSMLYAAGGTVYIAGRSEEKANKAIEDIMAQHASTANTGKLHFLHVALDDLASVKNAADEFLHRESRLDVLFNNAGVSNPPAGSKSVQGHELSMATNCLAPYLLTKLLSPLLASTAKTTTPASVRVVFTCSITSDLQAPSGAFKLEHLENPPANDQQINYANSKTANHFLACYFDSLLSRDGVLCVVQNPGNLKTSLLRHMPSIVGIIVAPLLYHARYGAYTEMWAGFSSDLSIGDGGAWILPFGRIHPSPRADIVAATKSKEKGGTGVGPEVVAYCDRVTAEFQ